VSRLLAVLSGIVAWGIAAAPALAVPWVAQTVPANQSIGAPRSTSIEIWFGSAMDPATILPSNILVTSSIRGAVPGSVIWSAGDHRLLFDPEENFLAGERVGVTLASDFEDVDGTSLEGGYHFEFSVWTKEMPGGVFISNPQSWGTGSLATNLAIGDLTGDGRPEAIFSNSVPDSLTILTPNAIGAFSLYAQLPTGILPRHTVLADIDSDSDPDLLCCASGPDLIQIFLNNGTSSFPPPISYPTGATPYGAFAGDLDADGDLDVATANFNGHSISILMNLGGGALAPFVDYSAGLGSDSPRWVDGADFDADGDIDLVCCNGYSDDVSIFLNDGAGVFAVQSPRILVGESPNFLEVRDFDGDSIVDIVTVNAQAGSLSFLRGSGDGTFQSSISSPVGGTLPYGIQTADTDGDRDLDVVVPIRGLNAWRIMVNDGSGSFAQGLLNFGGEHCHTIGVADWNLDGDLDVVSGFAISKTMHFYGQALAPAVVATSPVAHSTAPRQGPIVISFNTNLAPQTIGAEAFMIDGDQSGSHAKSVVWNSIQKKITLTPTTPFLPGEVVTVTSTDGLTAVEGLAFPGFSFEFMVETEPAVASFSGDAVPVPNEDTVQMIAGDFDQDGLSDLAVAGFLSDAVTILFGSPNGLRASPRWDVDHGPIDLWCGDLDGDGLLDLAAATLISSSISILHNDGAGVFSSGGSLSTDGYPISVAGGDFDLDGDLDLLAGEVQPNNVRIFWNDGTGAFPTATSVPSSAKPMDVTVADFNLDGALDLALVDSESSVIHVYRNVPGSGFTLAGTPPCGSGPISIFPWDVDGDRRSDLVTANYSSSSISILRNQGNMQFSAPTFLPAEDLPHSIAGADLNGDAHVDLVAANSGSSTVSVYINQGSGSFEPPSPVSVGNTPYSVACGDWDGDGIVDIASLNRGDDTVSLLWNQQGTGVATLLEAQDTRILRSAPNPFRAGTSVQFQLARPGEVRLHVFDVQGREIARLLQGIRAAGRHTVEWNGMDGEGRPVGAGVYFLQLDAGGKSLSHKVLRVR